MGDPGDWIQIVVIVGIILIVVLRGFFRIFIKPFIPEQAPGPRGPSRGKQVKDLIEELRRDLGHGDLPSPKTDGLLDEEEPKVRPILEQPVGPLQTEPDLRRFERPPEPQIHPLARPPVRERKRPQRPPVQMPPEFISPEEAALKRKVADRARAALRARMDARAAVLPEIDEGLQDLLAESIETAIVIKEILGPPKAHLKFPPPFLLRKKEYGR